MSSTTCKDAGNEEVVHLIDTKISQADDALEIIHLKRQRNTLVPTSRLPPELLCIIFSFVKLARRRAYEDNGRKFLELVKLTHVCHWWREVGLQAPFLWNDIPIGYPQWAEEMLRRSKDTFLTVTADISSMGLQKIQTLRTTLLQISRIHELNLCDVDQFDLHDMCPSAVEQELPLHTLRLVPRSEDQELLFGIFVFPDGLEFGSQLTSLRRLALTSSGFNWDAPSLCHLTHLRLSALPDDLHCYTIDIFLLAMQGMPALEMLDYEKFTKVKEYDSSLSKARNIPNFLLPNLKFLRLAVEMHSLAIIISSIILPLTPVMDLYGFESSSSTSAFPITLSALSLRLQPAKIRALSLNNSGECTLQSWPMILSQHDIWTSRILPSMVTILSWDKWEESSEICFLQSLFDFMRLDNLVTLSLSSTALMDAPTWARTFGTLPALKFVDIDGYNAPGMFESLTDGILTKNSIPFPSLHSISIAVIDDFEDLQWLEDFMIGILIQRYELGLDIRELIFKDCSILSDDLVHRVRQVVVDAEVTIKDFLLPVTHPEAELHPFFEDSQGPMPDRVGFWS